MATLSLSQNTEFLITYSSQVPLELNMNMWINPSVWVCSWIGTHKTTYPCVTNQSGRQTQSCPMPVRVDRLPRRLTNRSQPAELERIIFPAPLQNIVAPLKFHHWQAEILHNTLPLLPLYYILPCFHFRPYSFSPKVWFFLTAVDWYTSHSQSIWFCNSAHYKIVNTRVRNVPCKPVSQLGATAFIVINY